MKCILSTEVDDLISTGKLGGLELLGVYNGLDTLITLECFERMWERVDAEALRVYNFSKELQAPALDMMLRGLKVDMEKRSYKINEYEAKRVKFQDGLDYLTTSIGYGTINPNSPKQLQDFFYRYLHVPPVLVSFKGNRRISTNREALEKVQSYIQALPFVVHVFAIREVVKALGFLKMGVDADGRIRTTYGIAGTDSGRWSSRTSAFESGGNLQNLPEDIREIIVADAGWKFIYTDLEQAESRLVGWLGWKLFGKDAYLNACEGGDLHTTVASMCFSQVNNRQEAEQPFYRWFTYRDACKRLGHGSNYLGTALTMARNTKINLYLVEKFMGEYFNAFPEIPEWHVWTANEVQSTGILTSVMGRRRQFFGRTNDPATVRVAVSYDPQSSVADLLNGGLLRIWRHMPQVRLLAQIHDAILACAKDDGAFDETVARFVQHLEAQVDLSNNPIQHKGRTFRVPCEPKTGWRWCRTDKDPDGLVKWKHDKPDERKRQHNPRKNIFKWRT